MERKGDHIVVGPGICSGLHGEISPCISEESKSRLCAVLTGHITAVTDIDCCKIHKDSMYIITVADDKTIMVWRVQDWSFEKISIQSCEGWFTITYCDIVQNKYIVAVTSNGYVLVWELLTLRCVMKERLHAGSIEGLMCMSSTTSSEDGESSYLVSCGADCMVHCFELFLQKH